MYDTGVNSDYGAVGTVCREAVFSGAGAVLLGKHDVATWSGFGLLCSVLPPG